MAVQIKGLRELEQNLKKLNKDINKVAAKAIRKGLNSAAKSIEKTIKPNVPTLKSSTNFRQKGTIKNNGSQRWLKWYHCNSSYANKRP